MARMPRPWFRASHHQWYAKLSGKQTPLGVRDPADEAGAWDALRRIVAGVDELREAVASGKPRVRTEPIGQLAEAWLAERGPALAPDTVRGYRLICSWLVREFPSATAATLSVDAVVAAAKRKSTWSDTHRANVLACVGGLLRWAGREAKIPRPAKASRGVDSVIPDDVFQRCLRETHGDFHQLLRFLWLTGCRPGEATGLTVDAVRWDLGIASIRLHKTRHKGKTRTIVLPADAVAILREQQLKYGTGLLFRGLGGRRLGLQSMTMRFQRLSEKIGHRVTSYQFRHTWTTRALREGVPPAHVAAMLGHTSTAMIFKHYSHIAGDTELLREHANRLAAG